MDPRRITGPHAWENPTDQVAVPFRGALASRLIAKHRGVRWQIAQAFGAEEGGANAEAGDLARRRLESNAWVPWSARGGRETPNRGVSEQPPATRLPSRAGEAPCSSRVGRETPGVPRRQRRARALASCPWACSPGGSRSTARCTGSSTPRGRRQHGALGRR
uniref:Uncharacterized protein n=1 Tax=Alexandrium monilatum TaxID=311494 RepID=A0A7S4UJ88_9DINO